MAIQAGGLVTFEEVFDKAGFDWKKEAAVLYGDGVDRRRIKVGGLGFDDIKDTFRIPENVEELEIVLDGNSVATVDVDPLDQPDE